ncbi:MAG: amidohydrolase family protein [Acidimicrobiia bacterium]
MSAAGSAHANAAEDMWIVDCDAHFTEPPDLWSSRAPKSMLDQMPVMKTENGTSFWFINGRPMSSVGGNTFQQDNGKQLGTLTVQPWETVDKACYQVTERLAVMDDMGIESQILFPNAMGFASNTMFGIQDIEQRSLVQHIYNDYLVDLQKDSRGRLFPQAVLPVWDMDLTVKEMKRLRDQGITGFTISDKPHMVGLAGLDSEYFAPMWATANEMGAVFNFHIGSGFGFGGSDDPVMQEIVRTGNPVSIPNPDVYWDTLGPQRRLAVLATQFYMSNARIIVNMCMSNIFDKYPNVKINSAESGIGWIPFILEAMEYQFDEMVKDPAEVNHAKKRPTEYFRDHIFVTYWFEKSAPERLIDVIGVNNVLVETDIPHPTCLEGDARATLNASVSKLDPSVQRRVLRDNAIELFGLPVPG